MPRPQARAGDGRHHTAPLAGSAQTTGGSAGTGADASLQDSPAQAAWDATGADVDVHERPGGAAAEQRVGAGVVHERGLPQNDERVPGGMRHGVVRRPADGGDQGSPIGLQGTSRVAHDAGGRQHLCTAAGLFPELPALCASIQLPIPFQQRRLGVGEQLPTELAAGHAIPQTPRTDTLVAYWAQ